VALAAVRHGALEVALVGDLDIEAAIAAAARTVGALSPREPKPELSELKQVKFPTSPSRRITRSSPRSRKGALHLYWPSDDGLDIRRNRRLALLGMIFNDRLRVKVREEIGTTYSPRAGSNASDTFPGYGYFIASVDVDPALAQKAADLVINIADELARDGVTEDELNRARQPLLTTLRQSLRSNGYWLNSVLAAAQESRRCLTGRARGWRITSRSRRKN
jgi:zinc protease